MAVEYPTGGSDCRSEIDKVTNDKTDIRPNTPRPGVASLLIQKLT